MGTLTAYGVELENKEHNSRGKRAIVFNASPFDADNTSSNEDNDEKVALLSKGPEAT